MATRSVVYVKQQPRRSVQGCNHQPELAQSAHNFKARPVPILALIRLDWLPQRVPSAATLHARMCGHLNPDAL